LVISGSNRNQPTHTTNMKNERTDTQMVIIADWKILAEHSGEQYYLDIESPCGNYGSSLMYCESYGDNPVVQCYEIEETPASMKRVPREVIEHAIIWESELNFNL